MRDENAWKVMSADGVLAKFPPEDYKAQSEQNSPLIMVVAHGGKFTLSNSFYQKFPFNLGIIDLRWRWVGLTT